MARPLYPPLHVAACDGDGETIEIILSSGADRNARSTCGTTAIMIASMAGKHAATRQLVQGGADVKIHRDSDGLTALHFAVNDETVEILLSSGADKNAHSTDGTTPIMYAVIRARRSVVQTLVAAGVDANVRRDDSTVLHMAMQLTVDVEMVNVLLDAGVDVNIHDASGLTAMHIASLRGHHEVLGFLSSAGADMDARTSDSNGITALHIACFSGHGETVQTLLSLGADMNARSTSGTTAIMYAVCMKADVVRTLVAAGADVNVRRASDGRTAFQLAAASGKHESTRILLESGADSSMDDGSNILHFLVSEEEVDVDMVKVLLGAGVDANIHRDRDGCTPAHIAAIQGQRETVVALLSSGADMDARSTRGLTPLMYAVMQDQHAVAQTLVDSCVDVDARMATDGRTALQLAAFDGHHEGARILLKSGADSSICPPGDGKSILHFLMIALPMDVDMVKVLLDAGADATAADDWGTTILHRLTMNQTVDEDVVGLLLDAGADPLAQDVDGRTPEDRLQQGESHDGVRVLLRRCATWRRRRWVFMLRSRSDRNMEAPVAEHRAGVITRAERKLIGAVEILGLVPKEVFRLVVGFL